MSKQSHMDFVRKSIRDADNYIPCSCSHSWEFHRFKCEVTGCICKKKSFSEQYRENYRKSLGEGSVEVTK